MAQYMRRHILPQQRRTTPGSSANMLRENVLHTVTAENATASIGKHRLRVSIIGCIPTSGTGSGSRGSERYHFAKLFPHFAVFGDQYITPGERTIAEVHFVIDDASTLFYGFDAFGSVIDARPFIEQIAHANALKREIITGPYPEILYFTGKREIFAVDTVLGKVSASHNPSHNVGGPDGVTLKNTIFVTLRFKELIKFEEAILHTSTLLRYLLSLA